jgi:integrase
VRQRRLDDEGVAKLKAKAKRYAEPDPELRGHYVRVAPTGAKSFWVVVRSPGGKQHWRRIGEPPMKIADARKQALKVITSIRGAAPNSFEATADLYLELKAKQFRTLRQTKHYLDIMAEAWAGRDFASIGRKELSRLLDRMELENGARAATYCLQTFRALANWYATRDDHYRTPVVKGMQRGKPVSRSRILDDDELRAIWKAAEANGVYGALLRVLLLTAQRREKVGAMRWEDLEGNVWTIPTEAREKGTAGELRLPAPVMAILDELPRTSAYVFPQENGKAIRGWSARKLAFDKKVGVKDWTLHDLRRTARSLMARAAVRPDIAERTLGHAIGGVEGIYDRHSYEEEKADALLRLAGLVRDIVNPPPANIHRLVVG